MATDFAIWGPICREDLPGLCDRVCAHLRAAGPGPTRCDVAGVEPDAVTVDALCRLQLAARRLGCRVQLRNASPELCDLIAFMGLTDVLPDGSGLEAVG
jgi:ABC-type transporter Mla MlaB component